jgi:hypothetical protein
MSNPGDVIDATMRESMRILDEMEKTKDLAQRKEQSEILRNLCQSAGVFFDLMTDVMADGYLDDDDEPELFGDEDDDEDDDEDEK